MPCRCDFDDSNYKYYPSSKLSENDIQLGLTLLLGLDRETPSSALVFENEIKEGVLARKKVGLWKSIDENQDLLRRVFMLGSSSGSGPTEISYIPRLDDNFHPRTFVNNRGAVTNVQQCDRAFSFDHGLTTKDQQVINNATSEEERNQVLNGKFGKMTIKFDPLINGVGGLPGLSTPFDSNEYENDIPKAERDAYCQQLVLCSMVNGFTIPCSKIQRNIKTRHSISKKSKLLENKDVLTTIFEFIDTLTLVNTVSSVCPLFHELIIYNTEAGSQIYANRIVNFCKLNKVQCGIQDIMEFKKIHHSTSWLEFYLLSGMIFLENFKQEICRAMTLSQPRDYGFTIYHLTYLILDPTMLVTNQSVLQLINQKRKKIISVGSSSSMFANVTNKISQVSSVESLMRDILAAPLISCDRREFSVSFKTGLPLYLEYLRLIANKLNNNNLLSDLGSQSMREFQYVIEKMIEKAKYFLEQSFNHSFDLVSDDVMLGLHFVFLDCYYNQIFDSYHIPQLDFTKLLRNRKNPQSHHKTCKFPSNLSTDFLALLISENITVPSNYQPDPNGIFKSNIFENTPLEKKVMNVQSFIKEHVIELSNISESDCSVKNYVEFLRDWQDERPTQPVDLLYHFHMLHGIQYYQDVMSIANGIKYHRLFEQVVEEQADLGYSASPFF